MKHSNTTPRLTIDNVVFGYKYGVLSVLLVKLGEGICKGKWGLPGDWLENNESLEQCAARSLFVRTGLTDISLTQLKTFSGVDRYPGKRIITTAFYTFIKQHRQVIQPGPDELEARWVPISEVPKLIFDHTKIFKVGLKRLRNVARQEPIGLKILPKKFTFLELQELYEAVFDREFDKPNFRRKFQKQDYIVDCNEKVKVGNHRAAGLFSFDRKAYKALVKQGFIFSL